MPNRITIAVFGALPSLVLAWGYATGGYLNLGVYLGTWEIIYLGKLALCVGGILGFAALCFSAFRPVSTFRGRSLSFLAAGLAAGLLVHGAELFTYASFWWYVLVVPPMVISLILIAHLLSPNASNQSTDPTP